MSRKLAEQYIFTPGLAGSGTIKIPGKVELSQLLVITNKSAQENLYALGDPTRNATVSYDPNDITTFYSATPGITTITGCNPIFSIAAAKVTAVSRHVPNLPEMTSDGVRIR